MPSLAIARKAFFGCFHNWRLWLIQFVGTPLLYVLFYGWILIPVASTLYVILNLLLAMALLAACAALYGGTLNYFCETSDTENAEIKQMFLRALRNILPILICAAAVYVLWMLEDKFDVLQETLPTYLRSTLSASLRKHISVSSLENTFAVLAFGLRWILIPGLILPFAATASNRGFRGFGAGGFRTWKNAASSFPYWLALTLAAIVGVFATQKILDLTPDFAKSTYSYEWTSLIIRLVVSYSIALVAWMATCSLIGRYASISATPDVDLDGKPGA
jgi:hypothetical protein